MCHYGEIWAVAIDSRQFLVTIKSSMHAYAYISLRVWVNRDNTQNCSASCRKCWDIFASTGTEDQERGFRGGFEQPSATWLAKVAGNGSWWCAAELERVAFGHRLYESSRAFRGFRLWFRVRSSFSEGAWIHRERPEDIRPKLIALAMFRSTFQSDWEICWNSLPVWCFICLFISPFLDRWFL